MFWIMWKALRGFSKLVYALWSASLFDEKLYRLYFVITVTVVVRLYASIRFPNIIAAPPTQHTANRKWNTRNAVGCSETRTALWNAVKRTVKCTVKHSTKRGKKARTFLNAAALALLKTQNHCKLQRFALSFTVFHCAFHCVTQRCARFTARFTAFHSAARISLQPKVCCGKFPISNAAKSSSGSVNLQLVCENHPSLERKLANDWLQVF